VDPLGQVATVTPIVAERSLLPSGLGGWGAVATRAAITQDVRIRLSSPFRQGETWTAAYRFSDNRPRGVVRLDAPAPWRVPGLLHVEGLVERQTYNRPALGLDPFSQSRVRAGATLSDWARSWLRWEGGAAYDRIGTRSYLAVEGSLNTRAFDDHVALIATGGRWFRASTTAFGNLELVVTGRSTTRAAVPVVNSVIGVSRVSTDAPLAIWPAASSGEGRGALLRGHALRTRSVITGVAFGRTLVFANTEYERPVQTRFGPIGVAGFLDLARASRRLDGEDASPLYADVGAGLRVNAGGTGTIRLDLAYGLRDGGVAASAGYVLPWGTRWLDSSR
jgi:hypothetical protein